ncbi:MAG: hypothetical protein ACLUDG_05950 [Butyricicoccus sp.]|nr:hypothetical protein [Butyricicoccus pullicaecorum]
MDFNALVDEIVKRVAQKIEADTQETPAVQEPALCSKPGLLILTQEHGTICHTVLESEQLLEYYRTDCALLKEYQVEIGDYEAVILFDLTNDVLARLASGLCDTPFTALAQKAILRGKKIFVPQEAVELFRYAETAPSAYYQMMLEKLRLLQQCGIMICPSDTLEDAILSGEVSAPVVQPPVSPAVPETPCCPAPSKSAGCEVTISKRVITERDLSLVYDRTVCAVHIGAKSILTDLARDYAQAREVAIIRDE